MIRDHALSVGLARVKYGPLNQTAELQACVRDLMSLLALPSLWSGREPRDVASLLFDSLRTVLPVELAYVRVGSPGRGR